MDLGGGDGMDWGRRGRLVARLDRMVETGHVTQNEAQGLRRAAEPSEFNHVVRGIRIRHAGIKLDAAVAGGSLTRADADGLLERLRHGEHPRSIRAHLHGLRAKGRSRGLGLGSDAPEDTPR
jgi:hypothetical protein